MAWCQTRHDLNQWRLVYWRIYHSVSMRWSHDYIYGNREYKGTHSVKLKYHVRIDNKASRNKISILWEILRYFYICLKKSKNAQSLYTDMQRLFHSTWPSSFSSHNRGGEQRWPQNKMSVVRRYQTTVQKWQENFSNISKWHTAVPLN